MTVRLMGKIFVVASLGTTLHLNVYYAGLAYTSATVASALSNVIPSFTFFLAFLLGMEKVEMKRRRGWAKVMGTIICIGGSMMFIFWKGGGFVYNKSIEDDDDDHVHVHVNNNNHSDSSSSSNWIKGSALILISHFAWSAWLILQGMVYQVYPARLSLTTLICFFASLQSSFLSIFFVRNPALWKLDWNIQLLCIIYCGVVISALVYYLQTWCIVKEGPVFVAMFCPLLLIIVAIFSAIAFAERLHLGSLIGAVVIVLGLYGVLWGKSKDEITNNTHDDQLQQLEDQEKALHVVANAK